MYLHFPICILQVHAGVVEEFAHRMNTFDKVPDAVVVSLLHHKAREIAADADAYTKLLCAWPVTQAEAGGEVPVAPAVLKLSDPTLHAVSKPMAHRLKISERLVNERIVHLIRAGSDGQKDMLFFVQCLIAIVLESPLPSDLSVEDSSCIQKFRGEVKEIVDAIRCISGAVSPGQVDSAVVKRLMNNAKANNLSMSGVVSAAMQASNLWQDFIGMVRLSLWLVCDLLLGTLISHGNEKND